MKITLTQLRLQNFKGAKDQTIEFTDRTSIYGQNASGKTRIFDAFAWLLFGKDSDDRKDFNIKCLDSNNEPIHRVETSVSGILYIDSRKLTLQRIYKEKWQKKRGEETAEFNGHETHFFVNEVPHTMTEYQDKINDIIPENIFKLLTNPLYFNTVMKWTERRELLSKMVGDITDTDVLAIHPELRDFYDEITGKTVEGYKKELAAKKKLLKESLANIPARIDEVVRATAEEPDYDQVNADITKHNTRIAEIDKLLTSEAERYNKANAENQRKQNRIFELQQQIRELEFKEQEKANASTYDARIQKAKLDSSIKEIEGQIDDYKSKVSNLKTRRSDIETENNELRKQWSEINSSTLTFDDNEFICPTCKRPFEADDIEARKEEMTANFNRDKLARLDAITTKGKGNAKNIEKIDAEIGMLTDKIKDATDELDAKQKELKALNVPEAVIAANPKIKELQGELDITKGLLKDVVKTDTSELVSEKAGILTKLDELKKQLTIKEQNEKRKERKAELMASEKSLNQQIADIEKKEFACAAFTKARIDMIESQVNSMFAIVKFKMFNNLINGGTEEVCEALIDGVPYGGTNNAAKIQAGLDIIRTLSKHYDVYPPVIIDNRESTTNIPDMECQVISLYVDPSKPVLEIVNE